MSKELIASKPTNHITNLKCFDDVARVLGNSEAQRELFKVVHCKKCKFEGRDRYIDECFIWSWSPQGHDFWDNVYEAIQAYRKT